MNARDKHSLSIPDFYRKFPDNDAAERWFIEQRWPDGPRCPHCGHDDVQVGTTHPSQPFRCRGCRKFFSTRTGMVMQNSALPYQVWLLAIFMFTEQVKGWSAPQFHRMLGVSQKTAWHLAHRIRECYDDRNPPTFRGEVEVDETYIGGKYKNMHRERRQSKPPKFPVVGIVERETGRVYARPVNAATMDELVPFVHRHTEPGTQVYADESPSYNAVRRPMETVAHSRYEWARDGASTNAIESFWAETKRVYHGTNHWWSRKHLRRYIDECVWRHNHLGLSTLERMALVARAMEGRVLEYAELTAEAPEPVPLGQMAFRW